VTADASFQDCHPDKHGDSQEATKLFQKVQSAWQIKQINRKEVHEI